LSSNKKKARFAYLKWRILNKIWIRTWTLTNWVLWWLNLMSKVELCWDWGRGDCLLQENKCIRKKEKWGRVRGGRSPGHKLNTNNITNIIILLVTPSVILLVKILCHHTINLLFLNLTVIPFVIFLVYTLHNYFLFSHCNPKFCC